MCKSSLFFLSLMLGSNNTTQSNVSAAFEPNATKAALSSSRPHQSNVIQSSGGVAQAEPTSGLHTAAAASNGDILGVGAVSGSSTIPAQSSVTRHSGVVAQAEST
jgi:hypothetical protein